MNSQKIIYCIGDSHADFFSGRNAISPEYPETKKGDLPFFQNFRLGPVLAYNLPETNTKTKGREKLFKILGEVNPKDVIIMLCFGEIDCRVHLIKQVRIKNISFEESSLICAERYFSVIKEVKDMGFEVIVWNAIPSSIYENVDPEFPTFGTCKERNLITHIFNDKLKKMCEKNNIKFISIFDKILDKDGLTNMSFYMDKIHLSQKAMPLALKELQKNLNGINFSIPPSVKLNLFILNMKTKSKKILKKIDSKIYRMISGNPTIPPSYEIKRQIIEKYESQFDAKIFIETGTYLGDTVFALKDRKSVV